MKNNKLVVGEGFERGFLRNGGRDGMRDIPGLAGGLSTSQTRERQRDERENGGFSQICICAKKRAKKVDLECLFKKNHPPHGSSQSSSWF